MATLTDDDGVFVIDFGDGENRTTYAMVDEVMAMLDEVAAVSGPKALITTAGGKIYSNGLDVTYIAENPDDVAAYVGRTMDLCARILTFPAPTAAAINGHAFGLGAFVALAHDHRVMRSDRGFICWPEIALNMTFPQPLQELNRARLDPHVMHEAMVTGHRYGGEEAVASNIVHKAAANDLVRPSATEIVRPLMDTAGETLGAIKQHLYEPLVELLESFGK
jgi:enoyl-CoA hydratase/carnithine racemase